MPRKYSGMWYEVHPTPVKGDDGRNIVYVRPKSGMKLTMKQLESYCERTYNLRYGEMSRVFDMFVRAAGRFLAEGYRIDTPIGSFAPKLSLPASHLEGLVLWQSHPLLQYGDVRNTQQVPSILR